MKREKRKISIYRNKNIWFTNEKKSPINNGKEHKITKIKCEN